MGTTPRERAASAAVRAAVVGFVFGAVAWAVVYHATLGVCLLMGLVFVPLGVVLRGIIGLVRWAFYF
jgi:hypothetical protein